MMAKPEAMMASARLYRLALAASLLQVALEVALSLWWVTPALASW